MIESLLVTLYISWWWVHLVLAHSLPRKARHCSIHRTAQEAQSKVKYSSFTLGWGFLNKKINQICFFANDFSVSAPLRRSTCAVFISYKKSTSQKQKRRVEQVKVQIDNNYSQTSPVLNHKSASSFCVRRLADPIKWHPHFVIVTSHRSNLLYGVFM